MRNYVCVVCALILLLSLSVPAFAADGQDLTLAQKETLYAKYQEMVAAANEAYGLEISVLPFDELETFYSEEKFAQILADFCGFLSAPSVHVDGNPPSLAETGYTVTTVCDTIAKRHGKNVTVSVKLYGTFEIIAAQDGGYEIKSQDFNAFAESDDPSIYYVLKGYGCITGYADGGRTMIVTQKFDIYVDNAFDSTTSVNAYFYFNDNTGLISAQ